MPVGMGSKRLSNARCGRSGSILLFVSLWQYIALFSYPRVQGYMSDAQNPKTPWFKKHANMVVRLTDDTFEHETQASTGQTTGSWLVFFHTASDQTTISGNMPDSSFWQDDLHVNLATLHVQHVGMPVFRRLQIRALPMFVYIHKGKMYRHPKRGGFSWEELVQFCRSPDPTLAEDVPPVPTFWTEIMKEFKKDKKLLPMIGISLVVAVVLGAWLASALARYVERKSGSSAKKLK